MSARPAVDPKLPLGGDPRVQLLPPSVRLRARAAATRRRLAMLIVLALVVVGGGYGYAFMRSATAQLQLDAARQATQEVLTEQAQYSEGTRAANRLAGIRIAQQGVTAHEIPWDRVFDGIRGLLPEGTSLDEAVAVAQAPWEPALSIEGPLRSSRLAVVTITLVGPTVVDPAVTTTQLSRVTGFVDARLDSSIWSDDRYRTVVRLMLDIDAVTGRFAADSAEQTEGSEG